MNAGGVPNTCKSNGPRLKPSEGAASGGRVSNAWATCRAQGDNGRKRPLIPHIPGGPHGPAGKARGDPDGARWVRVRLASWRGSGPPKRRSVAGLRGRTATLGLRHGPDSCGRQQWGIFVNGGNPERAMPRERGRSSDRKALLPGTKGRKSGKLSE